MTHRTASCHCGDFELICIGDPHKISVCHCIDCQKRTGSAFGAAVFYERDRVSVVRGASQSFERPSASGLPVNFHFCVRCGSNLYWEPARSPKLLAVALGAFTDASFLKPHQSVWMKDQLSWVALPEAIAQFDLNPHPSTVSIE